MPHYLSKANRQLKLKIGECQNHKAKDGKPPPAFYVAI